MTMPSESHPPVPLPHPDGPLAPYRVLDFSDVKGQLCGRLLAELGADVIKVEPRGGDPTRERGPFYRDQPGREHSLVWWALNAGKRSITLELRLEEGRELARRLAEHADIVIQTFQPGEARALGLDYATLARRNPGIVVVSITNFGLTGPYRAKEATDIVGSAMGGHMMLNGDPERGPVRTTVPQAYTQVNVQACVGALIALYGRWNNGGRGQLVDVSMQEAMANTMDNAQQIWDIRRVNPRGPGIRRNRDGVPGPRYLYEAADGWVACLAYGGLVGPTSEAIVAWLAEHGEAGALTTAAWRDRLRGAQPLTPEEGAYLEERLAAFCRR
ncbi:MAG: CoA transferase, partial [Chloroflexota bacterium]|nr:CoA transferase [Dehalococcoidia bacterium]MDW8047883.1 CoA transferase [Chloroflexota bacterium]